MPVRQVIFKGRQYAMDDLTEDTRKMFALLKAASDQINQAQASLALAETARAVLSAKLDEALTGVPSIEPSGES